MTFIRFLPWPRPFSGGLLLSLRIFEMDKFGKMAKLSGNQLLFADKIDIMKNKCDRERAERAMV